MTLKNPIPITVLMAVYNGEQYLEQAIESVLNQTFRKFEFIIINDGSTDKSASILNRYANQDRRIKIITNKKNLGLATSLNTGIRQSSGKYIARIDADDFMWPNRLQVQYRFMQAYPSIILSGSASENIDQQGRVVYHFIPETNPNKLAKKLELANQIYHPTIIIRNHPDLKYRPQILVAEDYDLFLRLISDGKKLANIPEITITHRLQPDSLTIKKTTQMVISAQVARKFYHQRQKTGSDNYSSFNPKIISNPSIDQKQTKQVLLIQIKTEILTGKNDQANQHIQQYTGKFGIGRKIIAYCLINQLRYPGLWLWDKLRITFRSASMTVGAYLSQYRD